MQRSLKTYLGTTTLLTTALLVSACGGGGGGSSDSDAAAATVVSRGIITGFGSVYVNGRKFETDSARIEVDDDASADESDLRLGMMVTVRGTRTGSSSGDASEIIYDNELKGPVTSITPDPMDATRKTLIILGQSVIVDGDTTIDDDGGLTFDGIMVGDVLEVSGYLNGTDLVATHIELQANDDEIEIRGYIENLDTMAGSFEINGFAVSYNGGTILDDIVALENGLFVEVEGQLNGPGDTLIADEIEGEDDQLEDADEAEIEGVISNYDDVSQTFDIQGQSVDASAAALYPASLVLANDLFVEVEGYIVNGVLIAEEIEQSGKKVEIEAELSDVGASSVTFTLGGSDVTFRVSDQTELEDDTGNPVSQLSDFSAGNFVEAEAYLAGNGDYNAAEIKRKNPDSIEIEAPVEDFDGTARTVRLLGIEFDLTAATFEDENGGNISADDFFDALDIGEFIEIQDNDSNGVFDQAELDD